ncbi:MAG: phytanoyl-CoA dioxygenase family protein [Acidimicrobiales bacterium]
MTSPRPASTITPRVFDTADDEAVAQFAEQGWLLTQTLDAAGLAELRSWVDEVSSWPDDGDGWLHHREMTDDGPKLCRSENLIPFHDGLRRLLTTGPLLDTASALLGETAVLYKEKINYKLPGGAGYAPHQDAPAYPFVASHVSCMVAIDDADVHNGCLEVVSAQHAEVLPMDDVGCVRADVAASFEWAAVPVAAGQTLWFHSRTPHRSGPNTSSAARRALYPTYNALSEGDLRDDYYAEKLAAFAADDGAGRHTKVSLIGDFQGRAV